MKVGKRSGDRFPIYYMSCAVWRPAQLRCAEGHSPSLQSPRSWKRTGPRPFRLSLAIAASHETPSPNPRAFARSLFVQSEQWSALIAQYRDAPRDEKNALALSRPYGAVIAAEALRAYEQNHIAPCIFALRSLFSSGPHTDAVTQAVLIDEALASSPSRSARRDKAFRRVTPFRRFPPLRGRSSRTPLSAGPA